MEARRLLLAAGLAACSPPRADPPPEPPEPPEEALVEVEVDYVDAGEPDAGPPSVDMSKVMASFSTRYVASTPRAKNVELAASRIDGAEVRPGSGFSFNKAVGPRSSEAGFLRAPTIWKGEMASDVGGGVCQVSSTLYAAVLKAGLVPTFRRPHSRWSSYILPGFDATVVYPPSCGKLTNTAESGDVDECYSVDLRFGNPYPFPVAITAVQGDVKDGVATLTVKVYGGDPLDVEVRRTISVREDFEREVRKGPGRAEPKMVQRGKKGSSVRTTVDIAYRDGKDPRTEVHKSYYKPVTEVWEVGTDWDVDGPPPWEPREEPDGGTEDAGKAEREQGPDAG